MGERLGNSVGERLGNSVGERLRKYDKRLGNSAGDRLGNSVGKSRSIQTVNAWSIQSVKPGQFRQ